MKNERLLSSMNLLDDKYINEANPQNRKRKKINWLRFGALAACVCLMVTALNLFLFIPFKTTVPDVSQYEDSEYFPIIEKINALSAVKPKYKNNFDKIISSLSAVGGAFDNNVDMDINDSFDKSEDLDNDMMAPSSPSPDGGSNGDTDTNGKYEETTDNQVEGVTEGDIIKRSDKYIFYLSSGYGFLRVYSIEKEDSKLVSECYLYDLDIRVNNITGSGDASNPKDYEETPPTQLGYICEMYLSQDCKTVTVLSDYGNKTAVIALDVSDLETKIMLKNYVLIDGDYKTSRMVDGKLIVITNKYYYKNVDFSKEETFIPSISYNDGKETMLIPMDNIVVPDKITTQNHTVISLLDENSLNMNGCASFLSFTNDLYITNNAIYTSNTLTEENDKNGKSVTEIACISYGKEFDVKGTIKVDGYIKDRYSFDEYKDILRVVTTTSSFTKKQYDFAGNESFVLNTSDGTSASLYCIDLSKWEVVASVENFAPKGETVRSVRFDKDYAYVCTAVQLTDPVFFFDLSDLNNITYKETGNIEGFSTSLINLGNGYLLGIGRGDSWSSIKVEVYVEVENSVESVCSYEIKNGGYSQNYKSYYINRDTGMFGFGYRDYDAQYYGTPFNSYVLLMFADGELIEVVNTVMAGSYDSMRSVYIDGYLYIISENDFKVVKI